MFEELMEMFRAVGTRRGCVSRCAVRVTALAAGILGFRGVAEATVPVACCFLCSGSSPGCYQQCVGDGYYMWVWTCTDEGGMPVSCVECFTNGFDCGGKKSNCSSSGYYCSEAVFGGAGGGSQCS